MKIKRSSCLLVIGAALSSAFTLMADEVKPLSADSSHAWLLHLPGIAGDSGIDRRLIRGLNEGGYNGPTEIYDWTGNHPGITALQARQANDAEAQKIADKITAHWQADPQGHILLSSHSGGTGLAVWALEKLPPEVNVDTVLLLSSALSADYDLSKALSHVRGKAYAFTSPHDGLVLGAGTVLFGTIDGVRAEAAGKGGFRQPEAADPVEYLKLIPKPYDPAYLKYDNIGDHIGVTQPAFAATVLAPLLTADLPPAPPSQLTTRPTAPAIVHTRSAATTRTTVRESASRRPTTATATQN